MIKIVFPHNRYRMLSHTRRAGDSRFAVSNFQRLKDRVGTEGLLVLKCSGKLVGGEAIAIRSAAELKQSGRVKNLVIVPGAQKQITAAMEKCGFTPKFIGGCRVTDDNVMRIATRELGMILMGIVDRLRACRVEAEFSLFGTFYGEPVSRGNRTGDITKVDCGAAVLDLLCGKAVVLAPLGEDDLGGKLSFNADDAAASAAVALGATQLILATDKSGIERGGKLLRGITVSALAGLIRDGTVTGGMVAKAQACMKAAAAGIPVRIVNGNDPKAVALALDRKCGTAVVR